MIPLVCYYGITLVVPLVNGALATPSSGAAFVRHAIVVAILPPTLLCAWSLGGLAVRLMADGRIHAHRGGTRQ